MKDNTYRFSFWKTLGAYLLLLCGVGLCLYVFFHDPAQSKISVCMFHTLTGLDCPGCGMTRAAYALLHGRFVQAVRYNPFIYLMPFFGYFLLSELSPHLFFGRKLPQLPVRLWHLITLGVLLLIYSVGRNIVKFLI